MADISRLIQYAISEYRTQAAALKLHGSGLSAINRYSTEAGDLCLNVLKQVLKDVTDPDEFRQITDALFQENYKNVTEKTASVQQKLNEEAGVGLKAAKAAYSRSAADALADKVFATDDPFRGLDSAANDVKLQSQSYADKTMQINAGFQSGAGMQVFVTREYDGVGVHTTDKGGGEDCRWCLRRCGTDVPYEEAYAKGMFERHPGCGCVITYKSAKGTFRQGRGEWEKNSWN